MAEPALTSVYEYTDGPWPEFLIAHELPNPEDVRDFVKGARVALEKAHAEPATYPDQTMKVTTTTYDFDDGVLSVALFDRRVDDPAELAEEPVFDPFAVEVDINVISADIPVYHGARIQYRFSEQQLARMRLKRLVNVTDQQPENGLAFTNQVKLLGPGARPIVQHEITIMISQLLEARYDVSRDEPIKDQSVYDRFVNELISTGEFEAIVERIRKETQVELPEQLSTAVSKKTLKSITDLLFNIR